MVSSFFYGTAIIGLLSFTSASPHKFIVPPGGPILPSRDPFYVPPVGYEDTAPGTILRHRETGPLGSFSWAPELKINASYQLLYRTNDAHGKPDATILSVVIPYDANMSRVMSIQDIEDAIKKDCATSYALLMGASSETLLSKVDFLLQGAMLSKGWVLIYPDHEGSKAVVDSGRTGGQATLDGIRALLASQNITGVPPRDQIDVQMWGYSGGSIPTEWAAELQPTYAPELNIKSAIIGGMISNLTGSMLALNKDVGAGYIPTGILGLEREYPELTDFINTQLKPENRTYFMNASNFCIWGGMQLFKEHDMSWYFRSNLSDIVSNPVVRSVMAQAGQMGLHGIPQIPLFIFSGLKDKACPIAYNDALVTKYCDSGIKSLVHTKFKHGPHTAGAFVAHSHYMRYATDRFDGIPPPAGCHVETIGYRWPHLADVKEVAAGLGAAFKELFGGRL